MKKLFKSSSLKFVIALKVIDLLLTILKDRKKRKKDLEKA